MPDADRPADANVPTELLVDALHRQCHNCSGVITDPDARVCRHCGECLSIPTEPGYFWCGRTPMRVVEVVQAGGADDPRLYIKNAYSGDWMDVRAFSWGARIPASPRLAAMEAVVRSSPLVDIDRKGNIVMCRFCLADPQGADEPFEHLSDCVWSRSQREKPKEDA